MLSSISLDRLHTHIPFTLACTLTLTPSLSLPCHPHITCLGQPITLHSPTYFAPSLTSSPPDTLTPSSHPPHTHTLLTPSSCSHPPHAHTLTPSSHPHWCSYLDGPCQDVSVVGQASGKGWAIIKRIPAGRYEGNPLVSQHTHAHTHTHTYMHMYKYKYTRTHVHIHTHTCTGTSTSTHVHMHTHQC